MQSFFNPILALFKTNTLDKRILIFRHNTALHLKNKKNPQMLNLFSFATLSGFIVSTVVHLVFRVSGSKNIALEVSMYAIIIMLTSLCEFYFESLIGGEPVLIESLYSIRRLILLSILDLFYIFVSLVFFGAWALRSDKRAKQNNLHQQIQRQMVKISDLEAQINVMGERMVRIMNIVLEERQKNLKGNGDE